MTLYEELKYRGLINDEVPGIEDKLNGEPITFYIGTDPSGDSLHIGHYCTFSIARRLAKHGHIPIILVGGATGLIGDPRPTSERPMITEEALNKNYISLKAQLESLYNYKVVNNYDWSKNINFIEYLRDFGKHFGLNYMLSKETVKSRLDVGITYTEFSYMIMQALDFLYLYENHNCIMQIGGADQWGNITSGIELIRKKIGKTAYGFTVPLITTASGEKFGKSEGNALWLDKTKTSSYELYQFLINSEEEKVIDYLKQLTFLTKEEIEKLDKSNKEFPHLREAGIRLAKEVIEDLHGKEEFKKAEKISKSLFNNNIKSLSEEELELGFKGLPTFEIKINTNLIDLLTNNKITASKREARELVEAGAITINGEQQKDIEFIINKDDFLYDKLIVIRRGRKNYFIGKKI